MQNFRLSLLNRILNDVDLIRLSVYLTLLHFAVIDIYIFFRIDKWSLWQLHGRTSIIKITLSRDTCCSASASNKYRLSKDLSYQTNGITMDDTTIYCIKEKILNPMKQYYQTIARIIMCMYTLFGYYSMKFQMINHCNWKIVTLHA